MSGGIEISSGRKRTSEGFPTITPPIELLAREKYIREMLAEIENDLHQTPIRTGPNSLGARNFIPVFIKLSSNAQRIVKALYEHKGWTVEFVDSDIINFYFHSND